MVVEIRRDRRARQVQPSQHQRMHVRRDRIRIRRQIDAAGERRALVLRVEQQRLRLEHHLRDHARLEHVEHVSVAIVVVPDVFLVQPRQRAHLVRRPHVLPIPVGDDVLPVRIDREVQLDDEVAPDRLILGLLARDQVIPELDRVLVIRDLGRVQAAVDVDDGLLFARQRVRLLVGDAARDRQPPRDVLIMIELREIRRV
jgi:hypothetical protein